MAVNDAAEFHGADRSMGFTAIRIKGKHISVHKSAINPDFTSRTVLVTDTWDYVDLWLKRRQRTDAVFYWEQARDFYLASKQLPKTSSPLNAYYCFLNAVKTLLIVNQSSFSETHGLDGRSSSSQKKASLQDEIVELKGGGVAPALCGYLKESAQPDSFCLKDILYNLVYIHRAYNLTFQSQPDIFIPLANARFVRKQGSDESWFCADITDPRYKNTFTLKKLSRSFEKDNGVKDAFVIRKKRRFRWKGKTAVSQNLEALKEYHRKLRRELFYIYGPNRLWYIKRTFGVQDLIDRSSLSLTLWAMHRLSELARYQPTILVKHFNSRHNWLLSEFIATAPVQFIDEISSEITGHEFMVPGRRIP